MHDAHAYYCCDNNQEPEHGKKPMTEIDSARVQTIIERVIEIVGEAPHRDVTSFEELRSNAAVIHAIADGLRIRSINMEHKAQFMEFNEKVRNAAGALTPRQHAEVTAMQVLRTGSPRWRSLRT